MLLLNGRPVKDEFLKEYAERTKIDFQSLIPKKTETFKLQESFWRIINQKEMKTNRQVQRTFVAPEWNIPATYDWYNPFTGSRDKLSYSSNYQPDANGYNRNAFEQVTFEYGFISVQEGHSDLFFWLNNHPINQTNPLYLNDETKKPPKPFMFRQVLPDRENTIFVDHERLVAKATLMLTDPQTKGYINSEALVYLAKSYGFGSVVNAGRKDVEKFLLTYAKKNPQKLIDDLSSSTTEIRAVIADAIQYGIIKIDLPYIRFVDLTKGKRTVNGGVICQVPNGIETIDYFVNWTREKDNSGSYNQIKKELDEKKYVEVTEAETA